MNTVQTQALFGTPRYMAPEQSIGLEVDGRADQFSLGCIVYEMLTGQLPWDVRNWLQAMPEMRAENPPPRPSELGGTAPPQWDDPILRALAVHPDDRFESIDDFARALDRGCEIDWQPTVDPMDVRSESEQDEEPPVEPRPDPGEPGIFRRSATALSVTIEQPDRPPSVVIDVESGRESPGPPEVRMTFRTRERFMREYRRNLSVGGLFVPSDELLDLRSRVELKIVFAPTGVWRRLGATVVGHESRRSAGRGFGLHIDPADRIVLQEFVEQIRGPELGPRDVLQRVHEPAESDSLSPGEGFVLSRVEHGMTLARLRSMCAGLPFDVDDLVAGLVEKGYVSVVSRASEPSEPQPDPADVEDAPETITMVENEVDEVLERVDFHRSQANYLGASEVLERAIEVSPNVAEFHYRLALLRLEFDQDFMAARTSARRAVKCDPGNEDYVALLESLQSRR
jgi:hypothetical protein